MQGDYEAVNGFRVLVGARRSQSQRAKEGLPQSGRSFSPPFLPAQCRPQMRGRWRGSAAAADAVRGRALGAELLPLAGAPFLPDGAE